ncbi:hypothetical protein EST38_g13752 [Candolleomyces aberdarensis]|uniref:Uncharacterized protein n=1 Tax=Candolleomyces aberdarensis TaxID=2316362 RepID=A0A4Q2D078_9AGAR|nr:hypothetical protein EST38_g13752 [Candolleomyces aberdarensis]
MLKDLLVDVISDQASKVSHILDFDVHIGADAPDYNAIANQESLSGLDTEMRKNEGQLKEILGKTNHPKTWRRGIHQIQHLHERPVLLGSPFCAFAPPGVWHIFHRRAYFERKYLID